MHPWLEASEHFNDLHFGLLLEMHTWLVPRLPAPFRVTMQTQTPLHWLFETVNVDSDFNSEEVILTQRVAQLPKTTRFLQATPPRPHRFLEIRHRNGKLVTTIELLRPEDKTGRGAERFQQRQEALAELGVGLVEIDLLQTGTRRPAPGRRAHTPYFFTAIDPQRENSIRWYVDVGERLPTIRVPLPAPHGSLPLNLETLLHEYLDRSGTGRWLVRQLAWGN